MAAILPTRFLFRYAVSVRYEAKLPRKGARLLDLPADSAWPPFDSLENERPLGDLRLAWNETGFGVSVELRGKKRRPQCSTPLPTMADGLQVWIDTRNTQSIHRASRFCHHFCLLPMGGGKGQVEPVARQIPIARAREEAPLANSADVLIAANVGRDGYLLEAWFPARTLHGYDPEANPRLGFYFHLRDSELGEQFLSVGPEFPFAHDPSLWATLELVK